MSLSRIACNVLIKIFPICIFPTMLSQKDITKLSGAFLHYEHEQVNCINRFVVLMMYECFVNITILYLGYI